MRKRIIFICAIVGILVALNVCITINGQIVDEPPAWTPDDLDNNDDMVLIFGIAMCVIIGVVGIGAIAYIGSQKNSQESQKSMTPQEGKFCPYCGTNNPAGYGYCGQCQKPLP